MRSDLPERDNGLILVREVTRLGMDGRELRRPGPDGPVVRIRRGAYAPAVAASADADDARYDLRIDAVVGTRQSTAVLSAYSAARVWRLPIIDAWPLEVHITAPPGSSRRSKNGVIVHRQSLRPVDLGVHDGYLVTSLSRTLIDLARIASFRNAVAALDAGLASGGVTQETLLEALDVLGAVPGCTRAERAIRFASPLATLPGESYSRVLMHELGFPAPELQHKFERALAGRRFADFWWRELRLVGEFDGKAKYEDPRYAKGRSPMQVLWDEKVRTNELREHNVELTRWGWADLQAVTPFIHRLEAAGLTRERPPFPRSRRQ